MSLEQNSVDAGPRRSWPKRNAEASADRWLSLAAAPTFALMALLTAIGGGGAPDIFCSAAGASPLGGMIPMYLLMSAFHSAPWLRLIARAWRNFSKETIHD
ncbi:MULTISPECIES: hypothetical protein [unclassified Bradyrhizobium]|jgi:hypothetical protein|uniref:hypothetical protein n=1 Tax=unclassified Bradyrhizobium TaxID=2631580 RepID=UPI001FEEF880|nr:MULTISPECIES: hypothetical protein [unclassified Bradyrhizobium]